MRKCCSDDVVKRLQARLGALGPACIVIVILLFSACGDSSTATIAPTSLATKEPTVVAAIQVSPPTVIPTSTLAPLTFAIVASTPLAGEFRANPNPPLTTPRISSPPLSERIISEEAGQTPGVVWSQEGSWDTSLFQVDSDKWLLKIEMDRFGGPDVPIQVINLDGPYVQYYVATFFGRYDAVQIPLVGPGLFWIRIDTEGSYELSLEGTISIQGSTR